MKLVGNYSLELHDGERINFKRVQTILKGLLAYNKNAGVYVTYKSMTYPYSISNSENNWHTHTWHKAQKVINYLQDMENIFHAKKGIINKTDNGYCVIVEEKLIK